jgi:hypothetical protein
MDYTVLLAHTGEVGGPYPSPRSATLVMAID